MTCAQLGRKRLPVVLVISCALVSGCGADPPVGASNAATLAAASHLKGLPTSGTTIGKAAARTTVSLYVDVGSPNAYIDAEIIPALLDRFVRPGSAKLRLRTVTSEEMLPAAETERSAARVMQAVGLQDRLWHFYYRLRAAQADLNAVGTLRSALRATEGVNAARAFRDARSARVEAAVARANRYAAAASPGGPAKEPVLIVEGPGGARARVALTGFPGVAGVIERIKRVSGAAPDPRVR